MRNLVTEDTVIVGALRDDGGTQGTYVGRPSGEAQTVW